MIRNINQILTIEKKRYNRETEATTSSTTTQQTPLLSNRTNTNKIANTIGKLNGHSNGSLQPPKPISSIHITTTTTTNTNTNSHLVNRYGQTPVRLYNAPPIHQNVQQFKEGTPVANKRGQRRSRSAEHWLDHKPTTTMKTGTSQVFKIYS